MLIEMDKLFSLPLLSSPSPAAFAANRRLLTHSREARKARLSLSLVLSPTFRRDSGRTARQEGRRRTELAPHGRKSPAQTGSSHIFLLLSTYTRFARSCGNRCGPLCERRSLAPRRGQAGGQNTAGDGRGREGGSAGRGGKRRST